METGSVSTRGLPDPVLLPCPAFHFRRRSSVVCPVAVVIAMALLAVPGRKYNDEHLFSTPSRCRAGVHQSSLYIIFVICTW